MKLYLVDGNVDYQQYMGDVEHNIGGTQRLVWADDHEQAVKKYEQYWENQCVEYGHTYFVRSIEAYEAIQ